MRCSTELRLGLNVFESAKDKLNHTLKTMQESTVILDGKSLSKQVQNRIRKEVGLLSPQVGRAPGLGVILVGDNPASKAYIANKEKIARNCGFAASDIRLPAVASREELKNSIEKYNNDPAVDGILLQLPIPEHLDSNEMLNLINPAKDADGLHPFNQGLLSRGSPGPRPCTPLGIMMLIDLAYDRLMRRQDYLDTDLPAELKEQDLSGKTALVIGRSLLVGKPVAQLLLERNATVISAHSRTKNIESLARTADILVAAVGRPGLVKKDWVKEGAIVIDVGINRLESGKLTGDVCYEEVKSQAGAITPVPGGVGPMTVVMLMRNTLEAFKAGNKINKS